jgi:hypothetical protein
MQVAYELVGKNLQTIDSPWARQVKVHTISKIKKRIPGVWTSTGARRSQWPGESVPSRRVCVCVSSGSERISRSNARIAAGRSLEVTTATTACARREGNGGRSGLPHATGARHFHSGAPGCTAGIPNCRPITARA